MHFRRIALLALGAPLAAAEVRRLGNPNAPGQNKKEEDAAAAAAAACQTSKILQPGDTVEIVGCISTVGDASNVFDGVISDFTCVKDAALNRAEIIVSNTDRYSIIDGFRLYANTIMADGDDLDPIKYKIEGRDEGGNGAKFCYHVNDPGEEEPQDAVAAGAQPWKVISKGTLPSGWANGTPARNDVLDGDVVSTFDKGDTGKSYTAVRWTNPVVDADGNAGSRCRDYRISFEGGRTGNTFALSEIELVGTVMIGCPDQGTRAPTTSPTSAPTKAPSKSSAPTASPTAAPTAAPDNCPDLVVANVLLEGDSVEIEGCLSTTNPENAFDGTTAPFTCKINAAAEKGNGIIVLNPRKTSIVTGLRVYANPTDGGKDPIAYRVEGRSEYGDQGCYRVNNDDEEEAQAADVAEADVAESLTQPWKLISKGELPWIVNTTAEIDRNGASDLVDGSDNTMGDIALSYTAVKWTNDGTLVEGNVQSPPIAPSICRDYRITFGTSTRDGLDTIEIGEIELVGTITDSCTLTAPTAAPIGGCEAITKKSTCNALVECNWKRRKCNPV